MTGDTSRWATLRPGRVPAPTALIAAHPGLVNSVALEYTHSGSADTTRLVQSRFYPELPFTSRRPPNTSAWAVLCC